MILSKKCLGTDEKCEELRAQVYFRLERWDEAYFIYQNLLRNTADDFEPERIANLIACSAMVAQFRRVYAFSR